jgi:hypothetical protein
VAFQVERIEKVFSGFTAAGSRGLERHLIVRKLKSGK